MPHNHLKAFQASNLKRYAPLPSSILSPTARQRLLLQVRQELQRVSNQLRFRRKRRRRRAYLRAGTVSSGDGRAITNSSRISQWSARAWSFGYLSAGKSSGNRVFRWPIMQPMVTSAWHM